MATGYTHAVKDGEVTDFRTFALRCARGMGALITMRDDPMNAPIPEEFKPAGHYAGWARAAREEKANLEALDDAGRRAAYETAVQERRQAKEDSLKLAGDTRDRYEAMLAQARAWTPPSPEHAEFKAFMESQLVDSIQHDCTPYMAPDHPPFEQWWPELLASLDDDIASYAEADAAERERTDGRNRWVRQLRESLNTPAPEPATT